jgi:hypothetical protein
MDIDIEPIAGDVAEISVTAAGSNVDRGLVALEALSDEDVKRRWRRGHHAFFVLIQGLILAQRQLRQALEEEDIPAARDALRLCTDLLNGSVAALRLAGNISPRAYEEVVRPSMSPPHVSEGFSGLYNADHNVFIRQLRGLSSAMATLPAALEPDRLRHIEAVQTVYEAHAYVCDKMVGDGPSIRMTARDEQKVPGTALLMERYQRRTLTLLDPNRRA